MKLTEYIKHTKNGIQCEFARNQTLRTELGARRNFALLTLYFAFLYKQTYFNENTLVTQDKFSHSEYPTVK